MAYRKNAANNFSKEIEGLVKSAEMSYMDAIVYHAEKNGVEIESAAKLVNENIREKLRVEAQNLNFIEKTSRLPF